MKLYRIERTYINTIRIKGTLVYTRLSLLKCNVNTSLMETEERYK